ncbi:MAG: DUF166 domain-containing protein [Chloroflexi bacterium]|nr:DUF166 domain-containing protein [Chloroflexota bacterium]
MRILAIVSGEYGFRHVKNIRLNGPSSWSIETWQAPWVLPQVIDYPEDYLPESFPEADLLLSFGEHKGVAELIPDVARMCRAQAVIAAIDNEAWLPRGLARQLRGWLDQMNVACATPKPLCSLTEQDYGVTRRERQVYHHPLISEFARYFGQPDIAITVDPETRTVIAAEIRRDAVCGAARYVAEKIIGVSADDVEEKAGLLHHHYPCLASMTKLPDFNHDTLMHASGQVLKDNIGEQVKPFKKTQYIKPA